MRAELLAALDGALAEARLVAVATVVGGAGTGAQALLDRGGAVAGGFDEAELAAAARALAERCFADFSARRETVELEGGETADLFVEVHPPPPRLVIVGAVHVAVPLVSMAGVLGFHTTVIDPRGAFATPERFAEADQLLREWPREALERLRLDEASYVAVLSHDLKIDLPALEVALRSPARYVGALGSRKTHAKRVAALEGAGFSAEEIGRIRSPIGLDLGGGRRAEEIALSVLGEVVRASHGAA